MKRILCLCLILCCLVSTVACGVTRRPLSTETQEQTQSTTSQSSVYMLINGEKMTPEYVLKINDFSVSYEEFRYVYLMEKANALMNLSAEQAAEYWTEETEKKLLDTVVESLRFDYAMHDFALKNNITLSDAERSQVEQTLAQAKKAYGEESFLKQLQNMYYIASYDLYQQIMERNTLLNNSVPVTIYAEGGLRAWDDQKLESYMQETYQCSLEEYYQSNYYRAKHILVSFVDGENGDSCEKTMEAVNNVYQKLQNGADFDAMIKEYNEDPGMAASPDGYVFMEGTMVTEFYEGTKALEMNAYSQPVKTSYGFHIILRLPLTDNGKATAKEEVLFGNNKIQGAYSADFPKFAKEVSDAYQPEIQFHPQVEGHINHESIL